MKRPKKVKLRRIGTVEEVEGEKWFFYRNEVPIISPLTGSFQYSLAARRIFSQKEKYLNRIKR